MKKYLVLLSVLGLTACGGGGGGGFVATSNDYSVEYVRAGTGGNVTAVAAESNAAVTGMVSEIGVAADGSSVNVGRSATNFNYNNKIYTSHKLDDANFIFADEGFGGDITFHVNEDGQIDKLIAGGDLEFQRLATDPDDPNTRFFRGQVNDETWIDADLEYISQGKTLPNGGLKYSDFGGVNVKDPTTHEFIRDGWRFVFAGGYDVRQIDVNNIQNSGTFTGKAVGDVVAVHGAGHGTAKTLDGDATLHFSNGNSQLIAMFPDWYNVTYTENGGAKNITFSNYNGSETYRLLKDTGTGNVSFSDADINNIIDDGDIAQEGALQSDVRYFGNNGKRPIESVGVIQVRDCVGNDCTLSGASHDEVRMNLSFGVK